MIRTAIAEVKKIGEILSTNHKRKFVLVFVCSIIAAILEMVGVSAVIPLIKSMLEPEKLLNHPVLYPIFKILNISSQSQVVIFMVIGMIMIYILKNVYMIIFVWIRTKYTTKVQRDISVYMMESYMNRGYSIFVEKNASEILHGIQYDVAALNSILNLIILIITKSITVFLICIFMLYSDFLLAMGVILASVLCLVVLIFGLKKPMKKVGIVLRENTISAEKTLFQVVYGIKETLVMRKQKIFIDDYRDKLYLRQKEEIKNAIGSEAPSHIVEGVCITVIMIVLCFKILMSNDPTGFIAILASFALGAFRILPNIGQISGAFNSILGNKPGLDNVYDNILEARKKTSENNFVGIEDNLKYADCEFKEAISVNNLSFKYDNTPENVLEDLSIEIRKNTSVAFVGESGAGKSTLADILLGLYAPEKGSILMDNIDIRNIPNKWSSLIGFVPQSIYLFDESIAKNVAFGVAEELIDRDRVRIVLEMSNVLSFVDTLPNGIDTVIGDRGVRLSGGQRQRIGIARALYRNPQILILDEATSALDNENEKYVMEAIDKFQGNITIIIIAHRLTTIKNCDKIYEIVNKKAVERKYEDLV